MNKLSLGLWIFLYASTIGFGQERPPEPPARIESIEDWRKLDAELLVVVRDFALLDSERIELIKEFRKNEKNFQPGDLSLSNIMTRRAMSRLAGKYEEHLEKRRALRERLFASGKRVQISRETLRSILEARKSEIQAPKTQPNTDDKVELARIAKWQLAMTRAERDGPQHFFSTLLGAEIARAILEPGPGRGGPGRGWRGGPEGPPEGHRSDDPPDRQDISRQIEQLRRQNQRSRDLIQEREAQIEKLEGELEKKGGKEPPR